MNRESASADLCRPDLHEMLFEARLPWFTVRARLFQAGRVTVERGWYSFDYNAPDLGAIGVKAVSFQGHRNAGKECPQLRSRRGAENQHLP
ncbi:hypothetical protein ABIB27_003655 [Arthrobacter sp. UYEF21]